MPDFIALLSISPRLMKYRKSEGYGWVSSKFSPEFGKIVWFGFVLRLVTKCVMSIIISIKDTAYEDM
jgi:hypothetical protein